MKAKLLSYLDNVDLPTTKKDTSSFSYLASAVGFFSSKDPKIRKQDLHNSVNASKQHAKEAWVNNQTELAEEIRNFADLPKLVN